MQDFPNEILVEGGSPILGHFLPSTIGIDIGKREKQQVVYKCDRGRTHVDAIISDKGRIGLNSNQILARFAVTFIWEVVRSLRKADKRCYQ